MYTPKNITEVWDCTMSILLAQGACSTPEYYKMLSKELFLRVKHLKAATPNAIREAYSWHVKGTLTAVTTIRLRLYNLTVTQFKKKTELLKDDEETAYKTASRTDVIMSKSHFNDL